MPSDKFTQINVHKDTYAILRQLAAQQQASMTAIVTWAIKHLDKHLRDDPEFGI